MIDTRGRPSAALGFGARLAVRCAEHPRCIGIRFPQPRFMPCADCGAAVEQAARDAHVCDRIRLVDFQMFQLRDEAAAIEGEVGAYFDSPHGRFELWFAERERRRGNL